MEDKVHPLVELVLARIESHPEEFKLFAGPKGAIRTANRWDHVIYTVNNHGSEADKRALNTRLDVMVMEDAYAWMLDELLNGEERRRCKEREAYEEERKQYLMKQAQAQQAIMDNSLNSVYGQYRNTADALAGTYPQLDTSIGTQQVSDSGAMNSIKKALGL